MKIRYSRSERMPQISVIIPTWNEGENIETTLRKVSSQLEQDKLSYEILVMDDDSKDGTQEIVQKLSNLNLAIKLIKHPPPRSFGYSVRDGIQLAKGELSVILMADLSDDPKFIKEMWSKYKEGYDVIVGSRFLKGSKNYNYPFLKMLCNRMFNIAITVGLFTGIRDTSNNFKAFSTYKAKQISLTSKGFEVAAELMLKMLIKKNRICEIPVTWTDRTAGKAKFKLYKTFINYFLLFLRTLKSAYFG